MNPYSIFLLEGDNLVREAFFDILEQQGYTVYSFENPYEAFDFAGKIDFQIAIIDVSIANFKIPDLILKIKKINPSASIIITVAQPDVDELITLFNIGFSAVLLKPVSIVELNQSLKAAEKNYRDLINREDLKNQIQDIKKEKQLLEESQKKIAKVLPLAELTKSLTHEFKNVLTTIKLSINFIMKALSSEDEKVNKHFGLINQSITHADSLVMTLLGLTKEKKENANLKQLLEEAVELLEMELKSCGIRVVKSIQSSLPSLLLDSSEMKQVLLNLMFNARDAMTDGGQLTVRAFLDKISDISNFVIEINDTGTGIAAVDLEKIFLPSYTTKASGNGMGLYISKKIIEDMGGTISIDSVLGKGSTFRLILPYKEKEDAFLKI